MRPIDADALNARFEELKGNPQNTFIDVIFLDGAMSVVDAAPTIDCEPVKHGTPGVALVEHRVSTDSMYCEHDRPDDGFMEYSVCSYLKRRDRHGKKGRIDRGLPRCTLFNEWLEKDGYKHFRCDTCKNACGARTGGKEDSDG